MAESRYVFTNGRNSFAIMAMPDGYCVAHAVMWACGFSSRGDSQHFFHDVLKNTIDTVGHDTGLTLAQATTFAAFFGVPLFTCDEFYSRYGTSELSTLAYGPGSWDLHMSIIVDDEHAYLAYDPRSLHQRRRFRYVACTPEALDTVKGELIASICGLRNVPAVAVARRAKKAHGSN